MINYSELVQLLRGPIKHPQQLINASHEAADAIKKLCVENEKLRAALIDAAGELQHAYIMGFTERYRYAARAARNAVAAVRESVDE